MNQSDLRTMRQRLADRSAGEAEDHPVLLALATVLFALVFILAAFI